MYASDSSTQRDIGWTDKAAEPALKTEIGSKRIQIFSIALGKMVQNAW